MFDELVGYEFDWFAIDEIGQIAIFSTGGWGTIPESIGADYTTHQTISSEFELPNLGSTEVWGDFAKYGLYVYDWQSYEGPYLRECTPSATISEDLKRRITSIKNLPKLDLDFASAFLVAISA